LLRQRKSVLPGASYFWNYQKRKGLPVMSANANSDKRVTFGIRVPNSGPLASAESIVAVAREAESLGYDSI
jgi:hypothetical protein